MKQLMYMLNSATPNTKNHPLDVAKIAVALDLGGQGTVYTVQLRNDNISRYCYITLSYLFEKLKL